MADIKILQFLFGKLPEYEKIKFLEWLYKTEPYKYEYATLCEPIRRFKDPKATRGPVEHG